MLKQKIEKLFDIYKKHPWLFAIGFYLFCCIAGFGLMLLLSGFMPPARNLAEARGMRAGQSAIVSIVPYIYIMRMRNAWRQPWYLGGLGVSFLMGIVGGILFGFMPAAVTLAIKPPPK